MTTVEICVLFKAVVRVLVDDFDALRIDVVSEEKRTVVMVKAPKTDLGKLIGRGGRMAEALRTLLQAIGSKHGFVFRLDVDRL